MTNGEKLCYMFPDMHYTLSDKTPRVVTTIGVCASFDIEWWNAEYKESLEQEPFKPMVEIDLYSVIKQSYIEREVLDKIRAEIVEMRSKQNVGVLECLDIIDKYRAENEPQESEDKE